MSTSFAEAGIRSAEGGVGPADERPLNDQERKIVTRLLSDPFAFPQSFKTWLISFLEGSDVTLPISSVMGLTTLLGTTGGGSAGIFGLLPAGLLFPCASGTPPAGTLLCNGLGYPVTDYQRLFDEIGYTWGGSGGTFNVPDLQNRVLVGLGPGYPLAATDGLAAILRGPRHHHGLNNHSHGMSHVHSLSGHSHGMSHSHTIPDHQHVLGGVGMQSGSGQIAAASFTGSSVFTTNIVSGQNTGGPNFSSTSGPSTDQTGGPNFTTTSGNNEDTTGGGPANAPSYGVVAICINY